MNTKHIAEEAWDKLCNNAQTKNRRDVGIAIIQAAIEKATEQSCAELIGEKVALTFELEKSRAAHASEERLGCRELAHREYHRGYQDGRKSREAYRTAQTAD